MDMPEGRVSVYGFQGADSLGFWLGADSVKNLMRRLCDENSRVFERSVQCRRFIQQAAERKDV